MANPIVLAPVAAPVAAAGLTISAPALLVAGGVVGGLMIVGWATGYTFSFKSSLFSLDLTKA